MSGAWGYIFLLVSLAVASPTGDEDGQLPRSLLSKLTDSFKNILPTFSFYSPSPTLALHSIELAHYYGYGAEPHTVTTQDGNILEIHRVYNKSFSCDSPKPVVIVQHGFLHSARQLLTLGPEKALGFVLANAGYDVWLINARGNSYSRRHTTLSPNQKKFWDFSYTENGMYDIPAVIDYVVEVTGRSKIHFIGHSMGTISFFAMGFKRPEVLSKVQSFTGLAPMTTASHARSCMLKSIMKNYKLIANGFEQIGSYEFLGQKKWISKAGCTICQEGWLTQRLCTAFLFSLNGYNPAQTSMASANTITALKRISLNTTNSPEPPLFDISKIKVPSQLYFGINDMMVDFKDTIQICKTLPKVYRCKAVDDEKFNHVDFKSIILA